MNSHAHRSTQRALIEASWIRCKALGLDHGSDPEARRDGLATSFPEKGYEFLTETTGREVLPYYESILSNSKSIILLTDSQGWVLNGWGDQRFVEPGKKALFQRGMNWQERVNGTNAIGTCIATGQAVQVLRDEHFLRANRFMIGSAAPILDTDRSLLGVLNVSSDTYLPQAHTLGMVKLMSQSIENRLIIQRCRQAHFLLTFSTNLDNIDSQWSGLLAFDEEGRIKAANRRAELMAGKNLCETMIDQLFNCVLADLKNHPEQLPAPLRLNTRQTVYGLIKKPYTPDQVGAPTATQPAERRSPRDPISLDRIGFGDARISRCIRQAECIIEKDIPILVRGETGVGKEVFVKALHQHSSRRSAPLVAINCAAIPAELVESELFGYERGAFTGANNKGASGLIRKAHQGTLFLDEIGEMPLGAQARLLRVLQERTVTPLGSTEAYPVDIKLVTATNRCLRTRIAEGTFRQDLFYRINGLNLELPPLRARTDKADLFRQLHRLYREEQHKHPLSDDLIRLFERHPWPGNIRQLVSVLQVGLAMAGEAPLEQWHLPDDFFVDLQKQAEAESTENDLEHRLSLSAAATRGAIPKPDEMLDLYQRHRGNVARMARELSVSRNTVYKRLKEHGLR